jgi:hypothetical protein
MFVPITSEVTIESGMVLKEIATDHLFKVGRRLKNGTETWGDDPWELLEIMGDDPERKTIAYLELTEKYLAEVEDSGPEH